MRLTNTRAELAYSYLFNEILDISNKEDLKTINAVHFLLQTKGIHLIKNPKFMEKGYDLHPLFQRYNFRIEHGGFIVSKDLNKALHTMIKSSNQSTFNKKELNILEQLKAVINSNGPYGNKTEITSKQQFAQYMARFMFYREFNNGTTYRKDTELKNAFIEYDEYHNYSINEKLLAVYDKTKQAIKQYDNLVNQSNIETKIREGINKKESTTSPLDLEMEQ